MLLDNKFETKEIVAIYLHEIGHVVTTKEMIDKSNKYSDDILDKYGFSKFKKSKIFIPFKRMIEIGKKSYYKEESADTFPIDHGYKTDLITGLKK